MLRDRAADDGGARLAARLTVDDCSPDQFVSRVVGEHVDLGIGTPERAAADASRGGGRVFPVDGSWRKTTGDELVVRTPTE